MVFRSKEHIRDLLCQGLGNVLTLAGCESIQNLIEQRAKDLTWRFPGVEIHGGFQGISPKMMAVETTFLRLGMMTILRNWSYLKKKSKLSCSGDSKNRDELPMIFHRWSLNFPEWFTSMILYFSRAECLPEGITPLSVQEQTVMSFQDRLHDVFLMSFPGQILAYFSHVHAPHLFRKTPRPFMVS